MQGDDFVPEEVLAWCDAGRDGKGDFALVRDQAVDAPLLARVHAVLVDFEPLQAGDAALRRAGNFGTEKKRQTE